MPQCHVRLRPDHGASRACCLNSENLQPVGQRKTWTSADCTIAVS